MDCLPLALFGNVLQERENWFGKELAGWNKKWKGMERAQKPKVLQILKNRLCLPQVSKR